MFARTLARLACPSRRTAGRLLPRSGHRRSAPAARRGVTRLALLAATAVAAAALAAPAFACPFCNAVSQTLRQEMASMDAVVIAKAIDDEQSRNRETGEVRMEIKRVLKGSEHVATGQEVVAIYYGEVAEGRQFMLSGVDPPNMQWSCLPVSERAEKYIVKVAGLPDDDPVKRLRFYMDYLQDEESMLSRDAYDEFAVSPYDAVKKLKDEIDHDALIEWIKDEETTTERRRLYFTMLGVCGTKDDVPMLEEMLRSTNKSARSGLDALIACYLTLAGEDGLDLIDELYLANDQAAYADTYAAIMAVRFHGTEGDTIARSALVESLHHVLDRKDLADLVIPDLARWNDWSQIDRLTELFVSADPENNWVRVPVVNYLRACPLPEAKEALEKCKEVDAESVRRANTFFMIPKPSNDKQSPSTSALPSERLDAVAAADESDAPAATPQRPFADGRSFVLPIVSRSGRPLAHSAATHARAGPHAAAGPATAANPLRLVYVVGLALASAVIAQFLLLTGGRRAAA